MVRTLAETSGFFYSRKPSLSCRQNKPRLKVKTQASKETWVLVAKTGVEPVTSGL